MKSFYAQRACVEESERYFRHFVEASERLQNRVACA